MKKKFGILIALWCLFISTSYADVVTGVLGGHGSSPDKIYTNYALIVLFLLAIISVVTIIVLKKNKK